MPSRSALFLLQEYTSNLQTNGQLVQVLILSLSGSAFGGSVTGTTMLCSVTLCRE
jgi:hypothetical protein